MHVQLTHLGAGHPPLLLAGLALSGPQPRQRLAAMLWPDSEHARANLRVALHRVQRGPYAEAVAVATDTVGLTPETTVDVLETARLAALGDLDAALSASTAELLPWVEEHDAPEGGWLATERRRWKVSYVELLRRTATQAESDGDLARARRHVSTWVTIEPHSEAAHRAGLRLAVIASDPPAARRLWADCEAMTAAVYRRAPSAATRAWIAALEPSRAGRSQVPTWPVVGRAAILATLARSGPTLVRTTPGLGGSRLLAELARSRESHLVVQGRAAVGPLVCFGVALRGLRRRGRLAQQALAALAATDTGEQTRAVFVAAVLETIGPGGALLLDDLHLFDQASLDVVAGVLRTIERAPEGQHPLVVGTAFQHETEREPLAGWLRLAQGTHRMRIQQLDPLSESDVAAILTHILGSAPSREALEALWSISGGYPGFVDLALRHWAAGGAILPSQSGHWSLDLERVRSLRLPQAAVDLIGSRIDSLSRLQRRVLEVCLCLQQGRPGQAPPGEVVMAVTGESRWDVVESLEHLERAGFTRDGLSVLGPYADPVLTALPRERYRAIHRSIAETLASDEAPADRVAQHLTLAGDAGRAAKSWLAHAATCRMRHLWTDSLEASQRAVDLGLPRVDELNCHLERFDLLTALGDPGAAREELVAARGIALTLPERTRLRVREARVHLSDGAYDAALATVDGLLERRPKGRHVPEARLLRGIALARLGRLDEARAELSRSREQQSPDDTLRDQEAARALVEVEMAAGRFAEARPLVDDLARLTAMLGYPYLTVVTRGTLARFHAMQGEHEAALDEAAVWISTAREHGFRGMEALALVLHASIRLDQGDYEGSLASFGQALPDITPDHRAVVQANIATCYLHLGQLSRAFAHYDAAIADADLRHEPHKVLRRRIVVAEARLRHGDAPAIAELADLRAADEALGCVWLPWITDLEALAAALRGDLTRALVDAVVGLPRAPDETERGDHTLAMCSLALGDLDSALAYADRQPASMRLAAVRELVNGPAAAPFSGTGAAVERLVLAHVRSLNGSEPDVYEAGRTLAALEDSWPQHGGALRRLLDFHTRAASLRHQAVPDTTSPRPIC